ncbi:HAD family hydrolase [Brevundimonas sp. SL130]|uniref:HAD family hydrolase n=1 Tax=Brevundimonas sp. SL130 TaxID=2995143 RepID=UPI00226C7918|nr:hypothetical protein [Brevundimonas sp. SL130]WAC59939.1 hypothetical protein OU998_00410 [Brevundimonas sp. SL130]
MHPQSLELARNTIKTNRIEYFSFDIFDTFLLRRTSAPDGVFEQAFKNAPIPGSHRHMMESFVQHRTMAEHKARRKRMENRQPPEVTIAEIYAHFPLQAYGMLESQRPALSEAEFQAELDLCFCNPDIHALLQDARSQGLKVGFLSDTYWSSDQLRLLLKHACPTLEFDFLYASCDHGYSKADRLFDVYLKGEEIDPAHAAHIGDNEGADVAKPRSLGLHAVYYPQAPKAFAPMFTREASLLQLIQGQSEGVEKRLDGGLRVLRRQAASALSQDAGLPALVGATVVGPVLAAFHRFIEQRAAQLRGPDRKVKIFFLARDGYLPKQFWDQAGLDDGAYLEINRRIVLIGNTGDLEPVQEMFRRLDKVDEAGIREFFNTTVPSISKFFRNQPGGVVSGEAFAEALPQLIGGDDLGRAAGALRKRLLAYIRDLVPDFDNCTDIVLADLGYSGTIQRTLRGLLDQEGLSHVRLHGVYIGIFDHAFVNLPEGDSGVGLIDSSVATPLAMRHILRNISLLEQFCSAPTGPVKDYQGSAPVREDDHRPQEQLAVCEDVRRAALRFFDHYCEAKTAQGLDPFENLRLSRLWTTAILARLLLLPTQEEVALFGGFNHHMLGSKIHEDMVNTDTMAPFVGALSFGQLCALSSSLMWFAGNMHSLSPMAGHMYAMSGFGLMQGDLLADTAQSQLTLTLIKNNAPKLIPASLSLTTFGELRLRVPVQQQDTGSVLAIPLEQLGEHGMIRSVVFNSGENSKKAMLGQRVEPLPASAIRSLQAYCDGYRFYKTGEDPHLLFDIPHTDEAASILTLTIVPLPPLTAPAG